MITWILIATLGSPGAWAETPGRGGGCNTVCSLDQAPKLTLTDEELSSLLADWAKEEMRAPTLALETLLFHADSTMILLGGHKLSAERRAFLETEISRDRVIVEMRIVDDKGDVRGELTPEIVALSQKQHLDFEETGSLGALVTAGQVKRVGLEHLWSRW